jgi:LPS-assembly protein
MASAVLPASPAFAQAPELLAPEVSGDEQMLLEADTLVYDNDLETVTAVGGVQIDYAGNRMVAQRVAYDRRTGRLIASGNVEIIDQDGNRISAQQIDVTDDFRDGFVNALRIETPDKTYFGAESAQRVGGAVTTFNNGVYTACEPCEERPDKAPIWRIKARKIIWNGETKVVRFERARFELFGFPIIQLPYFEIADPAAKRKSGFLIPSIRYKSELGVGFSAPYYFALSPTYDLLVTPTYYTRQGFMLEAEWRQQFDNGQYDIRIAGIRQNDPLLFRNNSIYTVDSGPAGDPNRLRGMFASKGDFRINPRWTFGWDVLIQSDKNFSRTYSIGRYGAITERSQIYLTGLNDRNYFDLRAFRFHVQEDIFDSDEDARNPRQPWVLPSFDYAYTVDQPVAGGELSFDINAQGLSRRAGDITVGDGFKDPPGIAPGEVYRISGIEGKSGRVTAEAEWRRQIITGGGLVITPLLHARGDAIGVDADAQSQAAIGNMALALNGTPYSHDGRAYGDVASDIRSSYFRSMATAGLDVRWPILFAGAGSSHVIEPIGQIFVRPNEPFANTLDVPNEDAQSFVFDATTLFERDKFSGYDRMEGGTRANVGIRYVGSYANGWATNALFGQSYHIAGENPFASPDLANVGAFSGLETDISDYVGMVGLTSPGGLSASASGRFDEDTFETRRAELRAGLAGVGGSVSARYAYIQEQPLYGFNDDRKEVTLAATTKFNENWSAFGSGTYDFVSEKLVRNSLGFSYDDECFTYTMTYSQIRPIDEDAESTQRIGFFVAFRTLGDFGTDTGELDRFE